MDKLKQGLIDSPPHSTKLLPNARWLFLAMFFIALPSIFSVTKPYLASSLYSPDSFKSLHIILRDLIDEGLIRKGHHGVVLGSAVANNHLGFLRDAGIDLQIGDSKEVVTDQDFDFVFLSSSNLVQQINSIVNDSVLVILPLGNEPSVALSLVTTYKIVYLRRFECTVVAMRKMPSKEVVHHTITAEEMKAALAGLEDVYLEPPRQVGKISRKINFLPDLLKDSLDGYPRRIFISDEANAVKWFYKNYPMRDQEFEVYNVEVSSSDWVRNKVKREDYVVMKAEAQVVEEMLKDMTLNLVDELFLECKNEWQDEEETNVSKRAYWQCLALYGKVRDEGIAVHQWWNGL